MGSDDKDSFVHILHRNKDALHSSLNSIDWSFVDWENGQIASISSQDLCDKFVEFGQIYNEQEVQVIVNWIYSLIHNVQRTQTPIFDKMMQQRNVLKDSLGMNGDYDSDDDEEDDQMDEMREFAELKKAVDDNIERQDNPLWHQWDDEFEQEFVLKYLRNKAIGFEDHADKFKSMSCLSKMKNAQMRKMEMCARHRKKFMKKVNKWNEIQNIIKYGEKPYYRSNGYDRTAIPSFNQAYGELAPLRSRDREWDPETDQTKVTKMFYVPIVDYGDLHKMVKERRFDFMKKNE